MQASSTNVRWRILAMLMAYAAMCHFNRMSIAVAGAEHIMHDYSISETKMGMVYSSYLFVYTLCMMPGGWVIDRIGPKKALMILGFGSAILVPMTGLASYAGSALRVVLVLCVIRALLGVVSTPMHPGAARSVSFWMPYQTRGFANGLVTGAAVAGIASTYFVFGYLMDLTGWPCAFLVAGCATLLLAIVWSVCCADHPNQHPAVNERERKLIAEGQIAVPTQSGIVEDFSSSNMTGALLRWIRGNRSLLLLTLSYAMYSYFQYLFFYWMQYYFDHVLELGQADGRLYATIATLAMAVGMISGGWIADRIESRFGTRRGRAITPACGMIASAVLLSLGILAGQSLWVVACFVLAMGALGTSESSFWVTGVELGRQRGGISAAILNTGGNAGGIISPTLTPLLGKIFGWKVGLGVASVLCIFGAALWWWIEPRGLESTAETGG
ncbi:MAG: MFS transporter [Planctomycetaceae bacterium]